MAITKETKERLNKYEKKQAKHFEKLVALVNEMKKDGMYSGSDIEYMERDLYSFDKWFHESIRTKKEFAMKFDNYNVNEKTES